MSLNLTDDQIKVLLQGIARYRVKQHRGNAHVEGYDIRAMLTRVFGFGGWDLEGTTTLAYEDTDTKLNNGSPAVDVCYTTALRLIVHDGEGGSAHFDATASGQSKMGINNRGDAHDFAIKTSDTQALKRAAINLGDQFGLSLYRKGSIEPLVRKIVGFENAGAAETATADESIRDEGDEYSGDGEFEHVDDVAAVRSSPAPEQPAGNGESWGDSPPPPPDDPDEKSVLQRATEAYGELQQLDGDGQQAVKKLANGRKLNIPGLKNDPAWLNELENWLDERKQPA